MLNACAFLGFTSRAVVVALRTSLLALFDYNTQDPLAGGVSLTGVPRSPPSCLACLVQAAMVSRICECSMHILIEDARLALVDHYLRQGFTYVNILSVCIDVWVWYVMVHRVGLACVVFRYHIIHAARVGFSCGLDMVCMPSQ